MESIKKKFGPLANIEFNKLFIGQIFSHFADAITQFVLIAILMQSAGSIGKSIAITFFAFLLPQFLLSAFAGQLSDILPRQLAMSASCIYRVLCIGTLIYCYSHDMLSHGYIYTGAFLLGIGAALFYTTKMAAVTNVVQPQQLKFANALTSAIGAIALLLGAMIANYLVNFSDMFALWCIAGMYLVAAILTGSVKFIIPQKFMITKYPFDDVKLAAKYLHNHKRALYLVALSIGIQFVVAAFSNTLNALITDYYGLTFSDLTYLRTLLGVGIILGLGTSIYFARIMRVPHLFASGFLVLCLTLMTAPLCHSISTAWIWLLPIGMADAVVVVMLDTILQKVVPDRVRGKVFGLQLTLSTLSFLAGTIVVANVLGFIKSATFLALCIFSRLHFM